MNASTSSSSSTPLSAPDVASSPKRNLSFLRPVLSCGGALLIGGILVRLVPVPTNAPVRTNEITNSTTPPLVLPASQIVRARLASFPGIKGRTLPGEWKLTTDATGRSNTAGEVARWVVSPGSHVEAGDSVVEISTGSVSRPPTGAEIVQNHAEQEQVQVAQSQTALAQNLSKAQTQLAASQDRVADAQQRVTAARVLVKRLIAGEKIPVEGSTPHPVENRIAKAPSQVRMTREQKRALGEASSAKALADSAKEEVDAARKNLDKAQKKSVAADMMLKKVEDDFKAEKTTADVLQNARADADDASSSLQEAQTRSDVAERTLLSRQEKAKIADSSAKEARTAIQTAQTASAPQETPSQENATSQRFMTADQAATLVESALRESKAATRQAERIHTRVEEYQRQVNQSSSRAENASKDLQEAQQHVLDSVPRATFVSTRAPASGTITWISRLAREVGVGQSVFGIARSNNGYLHFEDTSEAWKKLSVGQNLNASSGSPQQETTSKSSIAMTASHLPSNKIPPSGGVLPSSSTFTVRITRISPPVKEGDPAQIDAACIDGSAPSSLGATTVEAELPLESLPVVPQTKQNSLNQPVIVPISAVLPRNGSSYVAVLVPASEEVSQPLHTQSSEENKQMTLQWRSIHVKLQTASDIEITSGLHEGEQLVNQPGLLLAQSNPEQKNSLLVTLDSSE